MKAEDLAAIEERFGLVLLVVLAVETATFFSADSDAGFNVEFVKAADLAAIDERRGLLAPVLTGTFFCAGGEEDDGTVGDFSCFANGELDTMEFLLPFVIEDRFGAATFCADAEEEAGLSLAFAKGDEDTTDFFLLTEARRGTGAIFFVSMDVDDEGLVTGLDGDFSNAEDLLAIDLLTALFLLGTADELFVVAVGASSAAAF